MKLKLSALGLVALLAFAACTTSARRTMYNSLASVGYATQAAYDGYLALVVRQTISSKNVTTVSKAYDSFQAVYSSAVAAAQFATNAPATAPVIEASTKVFSEINRAKEEK